jgi:hypothetical protein
LDNWIMLWLSLVTLILPLYCHGELGFDRRFHKKERKK